MLPVSSLVPRTRPPKSTRRRSRMRMRLEARRVETAIGTMTTSDSVRRKIVKRTKATMVTRPSRLRNRTLFVACSSSDVSWEACPRSS